MNVALINIKVVESDDETDYIVDVVFAGGANLKSEGAQKTWEAILTALSSINNPTNKETD